MYAPSEGSYFFSASTLLFFLNRVVSYIFSGHPPLMFVSTYTVYMHEFGEGSRLAPGVEVWEGKRAICSGLSLSNWIVVSFPARNDSH